LSAERCESLNQDAVRISAGGSPDYSSDSGNQKRKEEIIMPAVEVLGFPKPNFSRYTMFGSGQCTWYAHGRMKEIAGKTITFSQDYDRHGANWATLVDNCTKYGPSSPKNNSIAVFEGPTTEGHVAFVYGKQGGSIVFSDSNAGRDNTKAYAIPENEFKTMCDGLICYLV
jgi:hypothetical protein